MLLSFAQFSPASKTISFQNQKAKVTTRPLKYRNFETSEIRNEIKIYIVVCSEKSRGHLLGAWKLCESQTRFYKRLKFVRQIFSIGN